MANIYIYIYIYKEIKKYKIHWRAAERHSKATQGSVFLSAIPSCLGHIEKTERIKNLKMNEK